MNNRLEIQEFAKIYCNKGANSKTSLHSYLENASYRRSWVFTDIFFLTKQGCILAGISFLSISSILLPTCKSGIRPDKYLSAAIFKEAVHSDDS